MPDEPKPLAFDPSRLDGLSEKLFISHRENNYGGAMKRLNAIEQRLAELTWANAPQRRIRALPVDTRAFHDLAETAGDALQRGMSLRRSDVAPRGIYADHLRTWTLHGPARHGWVSATSVRACRVWP